MEEEIRSFLTRSSHLKGEKGTVQIAKIMAQITIFTASRTLQGKEVRQQLDTTFADLYKALDDGFQPINFMLPWFPLSANRKRNIAQRKMAQIYSNIIATSRAAPGVGGWPTTVQAVQIQCRILRVLARGANQIELRDLTSLSPNHCPCKTSILSKDKHVVS